jgi:hypothetical protein
MPASHPILHENLSLVEVRDPLILDQLLADAAVAGHLAARLSDRIAVVRPDRLEALAERLRKLGHLPQSRGNR